MSDRPASEVRAAAADPARLLDELKRVAVEQLAAVPGGLYQPIEAQLQDLLRMGNGELSYRNDLMTVLALRQRSSSYVMRYRELIARSFDDFRGGTFHPKTGLPMGLVRESELGFHLSGQRMAESISRRYQRPLEMLDQRFEAMATALGTPSNSNPVGAIQLAGAFLQIFRDAEISATLQPLLFRQYENELAKVLGDLYGRLNKELSDHGFNVEKRETGAAPKQPMHTTGPVATPAKAGNGADVFRVSAEARVRHQRLRDSLHAWRGGDGAQADGAGQGGQVLRIQELVSVASLLQNEGSRPFDAALAANDGSLNKVIRRELLEGARRLGLDPDQSTLEPQQQDAIDLTGLLFESLLQTHALVAHSRRMFSRLVMCYVKVALTDENLFVRPDHPARRLLDALALGCESNDGASPQDRQLLEHAQAMVERVIAEYNEDLAVFELTANEMHDLLEQQHRRAEVVERRSAETVHGRERLLQARLQAANSLAQRLSGRTLTPTIAEFLERHWQHHLVQVLLREGRASERHSQVLALADELISVDQAAGSGLGNEVADRVLALFDRLVECLSSSGLDDKVASEWMAGLARTLAFPDAPREPCATPAMPQVSDDSDDTRLLQVVAGNDSLDFDEIVAQRLRGLPVGTWMRLAEQDGAEGSVKIAWVSPLTSRLLLVNRRGVRKLVASPEQLAALVKHRHLFVDADELPFDEAMRQVRERIAGAVAQAA